MRFVDDFHMRGVAVLRVAVGVIFLWAGLDKVMNPFTSAGFLKFGTGGTLGWPFVSGAAADGTVFNPTHDFWVNLAGNATMMQLLDTLVIVGEVGIGIALVLGLLTRFAAICGTLMMLLFFVAAWDFAYGIVNQHLAYAVVTAFVGYIGAGHFYGLDPWLEARVGPRVARWFCSGGTEAQREALGLVPPVGIPAGLPA